jgi:hypothetical protein
LLIAKNAKIAKHRRNCFAQPKLPVLHQTVSATAFQFGFFGNCHFWQLSFRAKQPGVLTY